MRSSVTEQKSHAFQTARNEVLRCAVYPAAKAPGLKRTVLVYIFRGELPIDFMLTWVLDRPLKKGDVYSIQVITNN